MELKNIYNAEKAQAYEKNTVISLPTYEAIFDMIQAYFRFKLEGEHDASLLVVGAGGGKELSVWGPGNPQWSFTGIDPSEEMLQVAAHKSEQLELSHRVQLISGTIDNLPDDAVFHAASCILVLHFIHDIQEKRRLLSQIHKHLKSGQPFALVCAYGERDSEELQNRIEVWKSFFLDQGYAKEKVEGMGKTIMNISFIAEHEIIRLLEEAGFTNITRFYATGLFAGWICHA